MICCRQCYLNLGMILLQLLVSTYRQAMVFLGLLRHGDLIARVLILLALFPKAVKAEGRFYAQTGSTVAPATLIKSTKAPSPKGEGGDGFNLTEILANKSLTIDLPSLGGLMVTDSELDEDIIRTFVTEKRNLTAENITKQEMKGKTLRVVALEEPPYVNYLNMTPEAREANNGVGPGIVLEILRELGEKLEISYELVRPPDGQWGELVNGSWTGMVGMLERGEADILAGAVIIRYDRHAVVDYSFPFMSSDTGMLIRSPDRFVDNTFLIVTRPFSWQVWVLIAVCIVISGFIFKGLTMALTAASEVQYSIWGAIWVFFSVFVQQGLPIQPKSWTCRTLLAFWWLAALTLVATFTGNMVALFAVDKTNLPFNTKEQLVSRVENRGHKLIMVGNSNTRTMFIKNSKRDLFKRLWYQMDKMNRVIYVDSMEEGVAKVKESADMVLLGPKETLQVLASTDCDVTVLDGGLIPVWFSICLEKRSPYTFILSEEIRQLVEKGFIVKWMNDYQFFLAQQKGNRCIYKEGISTKGTAIDVDRAQGAIWILVSGVVLGLAGVFSEWIFKGIYFILDKAGCIGCCLARSVGIRSSTTWRQSSLKSPPEIRGWSASDKVLHDHGLNGTVQQTPGVDGEIDIEGFNNTRTDIYSTDYSNGLEKPTNGHVNGVNGYSNGYLKHRKTNGQA